MAKTARIMINPKPLPPAGAACIHSNASKGNPKRNLCSYCTTGQAFGTRLAPRLDSMTNLPHGVKVLVQIVVGMKLRCQDFTRLEEVAQVGARVARADPAGTGGVERAGVGGIAGVLDGNRAGGSEQQAIAGIAGGQHAV